MGMKVDRAVLREGQVEKQRGKCGERHTDGAEVKGSQVGREAHIEEGWGWPSQEVQTQGVVSF